MAAAPEVSEEQIRKVSEQDDEEVLNRVDPEMQ